MQKPVVLPDGRTVRLEHVRIGGRLMTSRAAVLRYIAAQQPAPDPTPADPPARSPAERRRRPRSRPAARGPGR